MSSDGKKSPRRRTRPSDTTRTPPPSSNTPSSNSHVDFIFLGTGTSGCVPSIRCATAIGRATAGLQDFSGCKTGKRENSGGGGGGGGRKGKESEWERHKQPHLCKTCVSAMKGLNMMKEEEEGGERRGVFPNYNLRMNTSGMISCRVGEEEYYSILIDCGKTFYENALQMISQGGRSIDAVLISHDHADAMYGLPLLNQVLRDLMFCRFKLLSDSQKEEEEEEGKQRELLKQFLIRNRVPVYLSEASFSVVKDRFIELFQNDFDEISPVGVGDQKKNNINATDRTSRYYHYCFCMLEFHLIYDFVEFKVQVKSHSNKNNDNDNDKANRRRDQEKEEEEAAGGGGVCAGDTEAAGRVHLLSVVPFEVLHGEDYHCLGFKFDRFVYMSDVVNVSDRVRKEILDLAQGKNSITDNNDDNNSNSNSNNNSRGAFTVKQPIQKDPYEVLVVDCLKDEPMKSHFTYGEAVGEVRRLRYRPREVVLVGMCHMLEHRELEARCGELRMRRREDYGVKKGDREIGGREKEEMVRFRVAYDGMRV
eukprot:Nk52_evm41s242 gene=Nk52_evmTU41s242